MPVVLATGLTLSLASCTPPPSTPYPPTQDIRAPDG